MLKFSAHVQLSPRPIVAERLHFESFSFVTVATDRVINGHTRYVHSYACIAFRCAGEDEHRYAYIDRLIT